MSDQNKAALERKKLYDCAELYDFLGKRYEDAFRNHPLQEQSVRWLINQLQPPASAHVLDVGSGTGVPVAKMLAEAGIDVVGIDLSFQMVEIAKQQVPNANFIFADALKFEPLSHKGYDAVVCYFAFLNGHSQEELEAGISKMAGLVRSGGFFVLGTVVGNESKRKCPWIGGTEVEVTSVDKARYLELVDSLALDVLLSWEVDFQAEEDALVEPQLFLHMKKR
jgi:ubiquinone/menaquinone biosynthesis C-methylase UbiE